MMSTKFEAVIKDKIYRNGPMNIGAFMNMALGHPELGYYMTRDPFGEKGDFTTAPEISQVFGELIGAWVVDMWQQMQCPQNFNLIECGPGRGTLMADILRVAKAVPQFISSVNICLIEMSPVLKEKQEETLKGYRVNWRNSIEEINTDKPSIVIGNEFLDALPIEQLKRSAQGWQKRVVTHKNERFEYDWIEADGELKSFLPNKTQTEKIYEVSPQRLCFIDQIASRIQHGGAALFIDYGYSQSHFGDTFQAVKGHDYISPLEDVGGSDITAHVDFQAIQNRSKEIGMNATQIIEQGRFLKNLGIEYRLQALLNGVLKSNSMDQVLDIIETLELGVKRLCAQDEMGALFKVLCLYKGNEITPAGF